MIFSLCEIDEVEEDWEQEWKLRALAKKDRKPDTRKFLDELEKGSGKEYKGMLDVIQDIGELEKVRNPKKVSIDQHNEKGDKPKIHEAKSGKARLFFFYDKDAPRTALFIGDCNYDKGKGGKKEQSRAFKTARNRRDEYLIAKEQMNA